MKVFLLIQLIFLQMVLSNCGEDAPEENGGLSGDEAEQLEEAAAQSDVNGIKVSMLPANTSIKVSASKDSEISDAIVLVDEESLEKDTNISIETGINISSASYIGALGVDTDNKVEGRAPSVVIQSSEPIDANVPLILAIPLPAELSLLAPSADNIAVVYHITKHAKNSNYRGILLREDIEISKGVAKFNSNFFGAYQAIVTKKNVTKAKEIETEAPIITQAEAEDFPITLWSNEIITLDREERTVTMSATPSISVNDCMAILDDNLLAPYGNNAVTGSTTIHTFEITKKTAHKLYAIFSCTDSNGIPTASRQLSIIIPESSNILESEEEEETETPPEEEEQEQEEEIVPPQTSEFVADLVGAWLLNTAGYGRQELAFYSNNTGILRIWASDDSDQQYWEFAWSAKKISPDQREGTVTLNQNLKRFCNVVSGFWETKSPESLSVKISINSTGSSISFNGATYKKQIDDSTFSPIGSTCSKIY